MFEEEKPAERAGYLLKLTREERTRKFSKRMAHEFRRLQGGIIAFMGFHGGIMNELPDLHKEFPELDKARIWT